MDQSPRLIYILAGVLTPLSTVAVSLRFLARKRTRTPLLWDDWTIVISLAACITTAILLVIGAAAGRLAQHSTDSAHKLIEDDRFFVFAKTMFAMQLTQIISIGLTKISVLLLYLRVFGAPSRTFRMIDVSTMVIACIWTMSFFLANVFKCSPVNAEMVPDPPDGFRCIDETRMFLAQAWSDVGLDVVILGLPLPIVHRMHMRWSRKVGVFCVFLLGGLTTAASLTRALFQSAALKVYDEMFADQNASQDITWFLTPMLYWGFIESSLGIVGACLPLYRPLADVFWIKAVLRRIGDALSSSRDFELVSQDSEHSSSEEFADDSTLRKDTGDDSEMCLRTYPRS